jgi:hypothetical protein
MLFDAPHGGSFTQVVADMVDETIGAFQTERSQDVRGLRNVSLEFERISPLLPCPCQVVTQGLMTFWTPSREAAQRCGIHAERIDEPASTERITDRILESIQRAEFVIVDLTDGRPNVYYEAGYANGIGKTPIYIARSGTSLEFDLKDYPVILFSSLRQLKESLEQRLRGVAEARAQGK